MILIFAALAAVVVAAVAAVASGGDLRQLGSIPMRHIWLVWVAIGLQTALVSLPWSIPHTPAEILHLVSYAAAGAFAFANQRTRGVPLIAAGGLLNVIAIVANGGVMPASDSALRRAGIDAEAGFSNSAHVTDAKVAFLGDVFAVPAEWPLSNVFSVGDIVVVVGIGYLVWQHCRTRPTDPAIEAADHEHARPAAAH